jgi:hypothetical protein
MVRKYTKDGISYEEPPYTPEEEEYLYRHMEGGDGPITIVWTGPAGDRYRAPPLPKPKRDDADLLD